MSLGSFAILATLLLTMEIHMYDTKAILFYRTSTKGLTLTAPLKTTTAYITIRQLPIRTSKTSTIKVNKIINFWSTFNKQIIKFLDQANLKINEHGNNINIKMK